MMRITTEGKASGSRTLRAVAVLLALAVVAWGVGYKASLYSTQRVVQHAIPQARLLAHRACLERTSLERTSLERSSLERSSLEGIGPKGSSLERRSLERRGALRLRTGQVASFASGWTELPAGWADRTATTEVGSVARVERFPVVRRAGHCDGLPRPPPTSAV